MVFVGPPPLPCTHSLWPLLWSPASSACSVSHSVHRGGSRHQVPTEESVSAQAGQGQAAPVLSPWTWGYRRGCAVGLDPLGCISVGAASCCESLAESGHLTASVPTGDTCLTGDSRSRVPVSSLWLLSQPFFLRTAPTACILIPFQQSWGETRPISAAFGDFDEGSHWSETLVSLWNEVRPGASWGCCKDCGAWFSTASS